MPNHPEFRVREVRTYIVTGYRWLGIPGSQPIGVFESEIMAERCAEALAKAYNGKFKVLTQEEY